MCEPSVVGLNPLLHQSIPLSGKKQSKPESLWSSKNNHIASCLKNDEKI
jgi:hypothetical protein